MRLESQHTQGVGSAQSSYRDPAGTKATGHNSRIQAPCVLTTAFQTSGWGLLAEEGKQKPHTAKSI